jgi:hypothetical protein
MRRATASCRDAPLLDPHPREVDPPEGAIESDLILEDYVERHPGPVTLVGGYSTALITTSAARKIYLDADGHAERRVIMERVGCEVVHI